VQRALKSKRRDLAYSTVKAILTNLAGKGYLKKRTQGKSNVFAAAISQADFKEQVVTDVLKALARDYRNPLLANLVDRLASDPGTLDDLEKLIARKRAQDAARENIGDEVEVVGAVDSQAKVLHITSLKLVSRGVAECERRKGSRK
jgi:predicted transcriptional regulator